MTQDQLLKLLIRTKKNHSYTVEDANLASWNDTNRLIDELTKLPNNNVSYIDILQEEFNEDIIRIKDETNNYRYFYKLSESKLTMKVVELLFSSSNGIRIKLLQKKKDQQLYETINEIKKGTQKHNEAQFRLDQNESMKLVVFLSYIQLMNSKKVQIPNYIIAPSNVVVVTSNSHHQDIFQITDDELGIIRDLRLNRSQIIPQKYDLSIVDELMEKLDENVNVNELINKINDFNVKKTIDSLIEDFECLLNKGVLKESEWSKLFSDYSIIFSALFGNFKTCEMYNEVSVSEPQLLKDKVETVDKVIEHDKSMTLIELKRHDVKLYEKNQRTRENIHLSKDVHNGVMQLMHYVSPSNVNDSTKNMIKKNNYLIIGDEEHEVNNQIDIELLKKSLDLYNNYLNNDIQVLTYRMVFNMVKNLKTIYE
ncbi:DUF4263 domain-containing protein [Mollicutes bacterium LVI A0039]|nr:DUF4263 domain-containing protein [Mollicutes bacterium LVI A0039]